MKKEIKMAWNLHRNTKSYVGAFPGGFDKKLNELIGVDGKKILHVFGGSVAQTDLCHTNDIQENISATFHFDARRKFPIADNTYDLVICDPPYDLELPYKFKQQYGKNLYGTDYVKPYSFMDEAVRVCKPNGFICVLHFLIYKQPKGGKRFAIIPVISGPNLRIRALNIFQKIK